MLINLIPFLFRFDTSLVYNVSKKYDCIKKYLSEKYQCSFKIPDINKFNECIGVDINPLKECSTLELDHSDKYVLINKFKEYIKVLQNGCIETCKTAYFFDFEDSPSDKFVEPLLKHLMFDVEKESWFDSRTVKVRSKNLHLPIFVFYFRELNENSRILQLLSKRRADSTTDDDYLRKHFYIFDSDFHEVDNNLCLQKNETKQAKEFKVSFLDSATEKLQYNVIRHIGHYVKYDEDDHPVRCQKYYYDLDSCEEKNVVSAFKEVIEEASISSPDFNDISQILYKDSMSETLKKAIRLLSNSLNCQFESLCINEKSVQSIKNDNRVVLYITDMIDSGDTFKSYICKLKRSNPNINLCCMSLFITKNCFSLFNGRESNGYIHYYTLDIHDVNSIALFKKEQRTFKLRLKRQKYNSPDHCPICQYDLVPRSNIADKKELNPCLTSYEFYSMCEECGYKVEDYPRKNRKENKWIIPDTIKIFNKNNVLLAKKIVNTLKVNEIYNDESIIVIFPYEDLKKSIEYTPSGLIALTLKNYNRDFKYFYIPRDVLKRIDKEKSLLTDEKKLISAYPPLRRLKDSNGKIIILDEINFSYKTFNSIREILYVIKKSVSCYFPIINLNSSIPQKLDINDIHNTIKFLNLYEIRAINE